MGIYETVNETNTSQKKIDHELHCDTESTEAYIIIAIITFIIVAAIIFGNILVILSVRRFPALQTVNNYFICSLAYADLIVIVTAVNNAGLSLRGIPRKGSIYFCLLQSTIFQIGCQTSIVHLLLIAADRYITITSPLLYHVRMTPRRARVLLTMMWAIPVICLASQYVCVIVSGVNVHDVYCNMDGILPHEIVIFWFAIFFVAPFTIMLILYSHIFWIARKHSRRIAVQGQSFENTSYRKNMKAAKTLCVVLSAFVLCWLPLIALLIANYLPWPSCGTPWVFFFIQSVAVSNSALNPAIYAYRCSEFRESFKKLLTWNNVFEIQTQRSSNATSAANRELQDV
ncbi:adrenocorticotropic hormone receptor-like [Glandiceps talaboti]